MLPTPPAGAPPSNNFCMRSSCPGVRRRPSMVGRMLAVLSCAAALRLPHRAPHRRSPQPQMVSERHIQGYKETMKLFEPLSPDAPLRHFPKASHVPGPDGACLVHSTLEPLLTAQECGYIIEEAEAWAEREGGWTSKRHFNHPTTDIPLAELPLTRQFLNEDCLPKRIYPLLGEAFAAYLPNWRALRVADAFVVKYNHAGGQTQLAPHRDGSVLSFNIALNERGEYEGGGTWFAGLGKSLPSVPARARTVAGVRCTALPAARPPADAPCAHSRPRPRLLPRERCAPRRPPHHERRALHPRRLCHRGGLPELGHALHEGRVGLLRRTETRALTALRVFSVARAGTRAAVQLHTSIGWCM